MLSGNHLLQRLFLVLLTAIVFTMYGAMALAADKPKAGEVDPKTGKTIKYWVAPMDPTYIREEFGQSPMGMDLVPVYEEEGGEKEPASTIRIDPVTMQNMGVRLGRVKRSKLVRTIRALGTVTYDETRYYAVNTKFDGWIEKLFVDFEGESVEKGQPLFEIYSPELVTAQEEYLLALEQQRILGKSGYIGVSDSSRRMLAAAKRRLEFWDLSNAQIANLQRTKKVHKNLTVFSPDQGVVVKKTALQGHAVKAGEHLYEIADLSRVWVDVEIYEYELPFVKKGMPATMELSYIPDSRFTGEILFIYPFLSPETRTVRLRLAFDNPDLTLKPNMYANVIIKSGVSDNALVIPQEAVIDSGERKVVFVYRGEGKFEPKEVTLGAEGEGQVVQILSGLEEGEEIVLSAQFMLDSESRLREAIEKMLEIRNKGAASDNQDLDMSDLSMDDMSMDDLSMDDMNMDDLDMSTPDKSQPAKP